MNDDLTDAEQVETSVGAAQIEMDIRLAQSAVNVYRHLEVELGLAVETDDTKMELLGHAVDLVINRK